MTEKLIDGGHIYIKCSNCNKPLVDLLIVGPNAKKPDGTPFVWNCIANCCYCSDKSFKTEVLGIFRASGIISEIDSENYKEITSLDDILTDDNDITFKVSRKK